MRLVEEIAIIIEDLLESDQPVDEIAHQVLSLIRTKDISEIVE